MPEYRILNRDDLTRLLDDPSPENRTETARKIAHDYSSGHFAPDERALAEDIFRPLLQDAEVRVRKALSQNLKNAPDLTHDIALKLAEDVAEVAIPMLTDSVALSDEDLITIVASRSAERQMAVAERKHLSAELSDILAKLGSEEAVGVLMGNEGAEVAEATFQKVMDRFGGSEGVTDPMAHRARLPLAVTERLVTLVSEKLRDHLVTHHAMSDDLAADLILQSREQALVGLLDGRRDRMDILEMIEQLARHGRLTPTIVLRALCVGDMDFFECALARLAGIPAANAHLLIHDQSGAGLARLCRKCKIPDDMIPVMRAAVDVAEELEYDGGPDDRHRYREAMIERVLTRFEDRFDADNFDYLIGKI